MIRKHRSVPGPLGNRRPRTLREGHGLLEFSSQICLPPHTGCLSQFPYLQNDAESWLLQHRGHQRWWGPCDGGSLSSVCVPNLLPSHPAHKPSCVVGVGAGGAGPQTGMVTVCLASLTQSPSWRSGHEPAVWGLRLVLLAGALASGYKPA